MERKTTDEVKDEEKITFSVYVVRCTGTFRISYQYGCNDITRESGIRAG